MRNTIQIFKQHAGLKVILGMITLISMVLFSCNKNENIIHSGIYKDGPKPLVHFLNTKPDPKEGNVGSQVTFAVEGLGDKKGNFSFYLSQVKAKVVAVSDSTVTITVPEHASSGGASIVIEGQTYFGPLFQIEGKVSLDPTWKAANGANAPITQILRNPNGNYFITGSFTDYDNEKDSKPVNHLALISKDGKYVDQLNAGKGTNGAINTIDYNPNDDQLIIGGTFGTYNNRSNIRNITLLNSDASLDSMEVSLINLDPQNTPNAGKDTVPVFNGGITGGRFPSVIKVFYDAPSDEVLVVGNYTEYWHTYYPRSTKGGLKIDRTGMSQIVKMHMDGSMDSTFNFDSNLGKSFEGGNGFITDAIRLSDGRIVIVGTFTTFDGTTVNRIACINDADGTIDPNFNTGSGADDAIGKITYNATTGKILITGAFKNFNGQPAKGVVMLNSDGTVDNSFHFGEAKDGRANYAGQLDNGLILVSGSFTQYNNIVRPGFMILDPDGSLADGYNNTGSFVGQINQIIESETAFNTPAVILVGSFNQFDNTPVDNIAKIQLLP